MDHVFSGSNSSLVSRRGSVKDPLTPAEKAYIVGIYNKAVREGKWAGKKWRGVPGFVSARSIAKDVQTSHVTVMNVIAASQLEDFGDEARGRASKFSHDDVQRLRELISTNLFASPEYIALLFTSDRDKSISISTVKRLAGPYRRCMTAPKPPLQALHMIQRSLFCSWIRTNENHIVERICEADESYISQNAMTGSWVWCSKDDRSAKYCPTRYQAHRKILIWGCFSLAYGASELFMAENMTIDAFAYRQILASHYLPFMRRIQAAEGVPVLKHDKAPGHTAATTVAWMKEMNIDSFPNPPTRSPDLTVSIEKIFGVMKNIVRSRGLITDWDTFLGVVQFAWREATKPSMCAFYADQFFHNVDECLKVQGSNQYPESGFKRIYTSES